MKFLIIFSILPILAISTESCGTYKSSESQFPWIVSIFSNMSNMVLCQGSIISKQHIVTAGHCLQHRNPLSLLVYSGLIFHRKTNDINSLFDDKKLWQVEHINLHPDMKMTSRGRFIDGGFVASMAIHADLAIVTLKQEIQFNDMITSVCLPNDNSIENAEIHGSYSGWNMNKKEIQSFNGTVEALRDVEIFEIVDGSKNVDFVTGTGFYSKMESSWMIIGLMTSKDDDDENEKNKFINIHMFANWITSIVGNVDIDIQSNETTSKNASKFNENSSKSSSTESSSSLQSKNNGSLPVDITDSSQKVPTPKINSITENTSTISSIKSQNDNNGSSTSSGKLFIVTPLSNSEITSSAVTESSKSLNTDHSSSSTLRVIETSTVQTNVKQKSNTKELASETQETTSKSEQTISTDRPNANNTLSTKKSVTPETTLQKSETVESTSQKGSGKSNLDDKNKESHGTTIILSNTSSTAATTSSSGENSPSTTEGFMSSKSFSHGVSRTTESSSFKKSSQSEVNQLAMTTEKPQSEQPVRDLTKKILNEASNKINTTESDENNSTEQIIAAKGDDSYGDTEKNGNTSTERNKVQQTSEKSLNAIKISTEIMEVSTQKSTSNKPQHAIGKSINSDSNKNNLMSESQTSESEILISTAKSTSAQPTLMVSPQIGISITENPSKITKAADAATTSISFIENTTNINEILAIPKVLASNLQSAIPKIPKGRDLKEFSRNSSDSALNSTAISSELTSVLLTTLIGSSTTENAVSSETNTTAAIDNSTAAESLNDEKELLAGINLSPSIIISAIVAASLLILITIFGLLGLQKPVVHAH